MTYRQQMGSMSFEDNIRNLLTFKHLSNPVRAHLQNVYATLSIGIISAIAGSYAFMRFHLAGLAMWGGLLSFGLLMYLMFSQGDKAKFQMRFGAYLAFTFLSGVSTGPLIATVLHIDPSIVMTAATCTAAIFVSLTLFSLFTNNRSVLYMGGMISSMLMLSIGLALMNIFMRSEMLFDVQLYLGLAIANVLIVYDSQMIVVKREMGSDDFIMHSLELFMDLAMLFKHLLVLLTKKERKNNRD